mgnify:CR=1 FL=1
MLKRVVFLSIVGSVMLLGLSGCPGVACFGIDTCQLQGTWQSTSGSLTYTIEIQDDTIKYTHKYTVLGISVSSGFSGTFDIDATQRPKHMDISTTRIFTGGVGVDLDTPEKVLAIYDVSRKTLSICMGTSDLRPDSLESDDTITLTRLDSN